MRILLDHCVDWRWSRSLPTCEVKSVSQMGWELLKNSKLLAEAAAEFDAFVTVDQNIKWQQNVQTLPIAIVVLIAQSNKLADLLPLVPHLEKALASLAPRTLIEVTMP